MAYCVVKPMQRTKKKYPLATNEASDGKCPPWSAAATGRSLLRAPGRRLSLLGSRGWAGAGSHAGSSDGDTAIEVLGEVVTWLMLVREAQRDEKLGLRRP